MGCVPLFLSDVFLYPPNFHFHTAQKSINCVSRYTEHVSIYFLTVISFKDNAVSTQFQPMQLLYNVSLTKMNADYNGHRDNFKQSKQVG